MTPIASTATTTPNAEPAPNPGATTPETDSGTGQSGGLTANFDTFLRLLTTQLRNQDPLNPLDSAEFVAQLASFSAVEQQTLTNQRLEELIALSGPGAGLSAAADWIGMEVAAPGPAQKTGDSAVQFQIPARPAATSAVIVIRDASGTAVSTRAGSPQDTQFLWDGQTTEGGDAPDGAYTAEVTYFNGETQLETVTASVYSLVREVRLENGVPMLRLNNGVQISADAIGAVRAPTGGA